MWATLVQSQESRSMTIGNEKIVDVKFERFADVLEDAKKRVHKGSKVIYVDSNTGSTIYSGTRMVSPCATISQAIGLCTAGQGDTVLVMPNHAETVTSSITMSKSDVSIIGFEVGNKKPVITVNGAIDLFNITASGCSISGLELTIITTDSATALVNVAASKCRLSNLKMIPSATSVNVLDCITIASGADDLIIENVRIHNTVVPVTSFISIEAAVARLTIKDCYMSGDVATGGIIDGATATQIRLLNNVIKVIGTNMPALTLDSNPTGEAIGNYVFGTDASIANNANWGNALILANNYTRGGTGSTVSASNIIPALDT